MTKKPIILRIEEKIIKELDDNIKKELYPTDRTKKITNLIIDYNKKNKNSIK